MKQVLPALIAISLSLPLSLCGHDSLKGISWSFQAHYGFIMPHSPSLYYMINSHIPAFSFNLFRKRNSGADWERAFNYPETGVCLYYEDMMNPEILGRGIGLQPYIDFPLNMNFRRQMKIKVGFGVGYLTKYFDRVENHKNVAIGSAFNTYVDFRFTGAFMCGDKGRLETGIGFSHFSNGAYKMPNLGVNYVSLFLGYGILRYKGAGISPTPAPLERKTHVWAMLSAGISEAMPPGGRKYLPLVLIVSAHRPATRVSAFNIGAEAVNNPANIFRASLDSVEVSYTQNTQLGMKLGYELTAGKLSLCVEMGAYVYNPYKPNGSFFHRLASRYRFSERWMGIFSLRTHWAKADHFEWGVGYRIK